MPANVKFEIDDAEESWTFQQKFDFIHVRYLAAAIADWPKLVRQSFAAIKPGGWAEFQDFDITYYSEDGSLKEEQAIQKWITILLDAARSFGRDPCPGQQLEEWMKEAGFQDVQHEKYRLPIGPWPKDKHLVSFGHIFSTSAIPAAFISSFFRSSQSNWLISHGRKQSGRGILSRLRTGWRLSVSDSSLKRSGGRQKRCKSCSQTCVKICGIQRSTRNLTCGWIHTLLSLHVERLALIAYS